MYFCLITKFVFQTSFTFAGNTFQLSIIPVYIVSPHTSVSHPKIRNMNVYSRLLHLLSGQGQAHISTQDGLRVIEENVSYLFAGGVVSD